MTLPSQSAGRTPRTMAIQSEARQKYPQGGAAYYMEIAECYGQECTELERENSKLKGQLEEAVGALKLIAGSTFKNCTFGNNAGGTTIVGVRIKSAAEIASETLSKLKEAGS